MIKNKYSLLLNSINTTSNVRCNILVASALAFAHIALGYIINRGLLGFSATTYGDLSDAAALSSGTSIFSLWPGEPFGYSLLIWVFSKISLDIVEAATAIVITSKFITIFCFYYICSESLKPKFAILATVLLAFQFQFLSHSLYLWVEGPFIAIEMLFSYAILKIHKSLSNVKFLWLILGSLFAGFLFNLRYIGACYILLFGAYTSALYFRGKIRFYQLVTAGVVVISVTAPLLIRNYLSTKTLSGHPIGVDPAYSFFGALHDLIIQLGLFSLMYFPSWIWSLGKVFIIPLFIVVLTILVSPALIAKFKKKSAAIWTLAPFYLLSFAYAESTTRLDLINFRFIYPVIPLFILYFFFILETIEEFLFSIKPKSTQIATILKFVKNAPSALSMTLTAVMLIIASAITIKGSIPADFNYSPDTINVLKNIEPKPEAIMVNRFGDQISIFIPNIKKIGIPFTDKANGDYTSAYGVRLWNKDNFIDTVKANKVSLIVFFMGVNNNDPFLTESQYGDFIEKVFAGDSSLVEKRQVTKDGVIIWLKN